MKTFDKNADGKLTREEFLMPPGRPEGAPGMGPGGPNRMGPGGPGGSGAERKPAPQGQGGNPGRVRPPGE